MMRAMNSREASGLNYQDVACQMETDLQNGLSDLEVAQRRKNHGYNEFNIADDEPLWKKYLGQVNVDIVSQQTITPHNLTLSF